MRHSSKKYSPSGICALTLYEPWASLVAAGIKTVETRSWSTKYQGLLAIHAGKKRVAVPKHLLDLFAERGIEYRPRHGKIVAVAQLTGCYEMNCEVFTAASALERQCGDWSPERYAWKLENIYALPHAVPATGQMGLWLIEQRHAALIETMINK